jgi:hypothetical protein
LYRIGVATSTPTPRSDNFTPIPILEELFFPELSEAGSDSSRDPEAAEFPPAASPWNFARSMEFGETAATNSGLGPFVAARICSIRGASATSAAWPKQIPVHPPAMKNANGNAQSAVLALMLFSYR